MSLPLSELCILCCIPAPGPAVPGDIPVISEQSTLDRSAEGPHHFPCQENVRTIDAISLPFKFFFGWMEEML